MKRIAPVLLAAIVMASGACKDPSKDKPVATVEPVAKKPAAASATAATKPAADAHMAHTLKLDAMNTKVGFIGSKVTGSHEGAFPELTGTIALHDGHAVGGSVMVELDVTKLTSDNERLTGHLKSPDFFDAEKFPTATFKSTAITAAEADGATHTIAGELTLHGVTQAISFPATISVTDEAITATSEFSINRKDFGIAYPGKPDDLIRDGVVLKLDINVPRG